MIRHAAYLLLIDGIGTALATSEEITLAYVEALGFDAVHYGLQCPTSLPCSVEPRTGMLDGQSVSFTVADVDGTLPEIFGVDEDSAEPLLVTLAAGTTAADSSLYNKHVGVEKLGAAGERRQHSCIPGYNVGLEHISEGQASATNGAASPVSEKPVVWAGRRAALYRLMRTPGGDFPDLTVESERLAARVWFGTLTGQGEQSGHEWKLSAAGEESWIMKSIGQGFSQMPIEVEVITELNEDANEHVLIGTLDILHFWDETDPDDDANARVYVASEINSALLSGAAGYDEIATAMDSFLDLIQDDGSLVTALTAENGGDTLSQLRYSTAPGNDGIQVTWDREASGVSAASYSLRLRVLAHEKVWKALGYDPAVQNESIDPVENADKFCLFERPTGSTTADTQLIQWAIDYPGHWLGIFWSASPTAMKRKIEGGTGIGPEHTSAHGADRRWPPIYPQGANIFDLNAVHQFFRVKAFEPLFLSASQAVPLPADPDDAAQPPQTPLTITDVGEVTHQGIVVFEGPYRDETDPEADVITIQLPARVAWRQVSDGSVDTDGQFPKLAIYDWPEPRLYGFKAERPTIWGSSRVPPPDVTPLTMRSLLVLEHGTGPDTLGYIMARLLATTGAAGGWSGYGLGGGLTQTVGPNDLSLGDDVAPFTDAEASAFGLGIPAEMIAISADEQGGLEAAIEQQGEDDVFRCKVVLGKVASAREVMQSMLAPGGWAISLAGGKFGLFDPFTFQAPVADTGVITVESLAGVPGEPESSIPEQRLRVWSPMDRINLKARLNPVSGDYAREEVFRSPDPQQMYRHQSLEHNVDGSHLIDPTILSTPGSNWIVSFHERWRKACRWWSRQHFECTLTLPLRRHAEFWPGSTVTVSNEWLVNPTGQVYGIVQAPGYVLGRTVDCKNETMKVRCIVDATSLIFYSPAAKATRYVENEGGVGYRLLVEDDYLGIRGNTGTFDVDGFVEPDHSDDGGDLDIEVFAFNGVTFTGGIYGVVDSINAAAGNCYIQLTGALTGATWLRDQHHIVVPRTAASQGAAWAFTNFAAVGNKSGNYTGSTKTKKFKD